MNVSMIASVYNEEVMMEIAEEVKDAGSSG